MLDSHKKRKEWEGSEGNAGSEPPFLGKGIWGRLSCNISSMRGSVSSPDETLRSELKKYDAQRTIYDELRGVSSSDEMLCRKLDIASQTK